MSNVLHSRFFRLLVCLILVASFLVNLSPLKAEATAVVGAVLSFEGLMAVLYSMGIGIVATQLTIEAWNKIGNSLTKSITDTGDTTITEAWIDLEAMYDSYIPGGGQDPDDELKWAEKLKHGLSRGLLAAIAGWLCTLVNMGGYEIEGEAFSGWTYYGDYLLPTFPTFAEYPYMFLRVIYPGTTNHKYEMTYSTQPVYVSISSSGVPSYYASYDLDRFAKSVKQVDIDSWNISDSISPSLPSYPYSTRQGNIVASNEFVVWSNYDVLSYSDQSTVFHSGSDPTTTKTEIIEPSIYVGDIPQQIKDGEKDKDNLVLPVLDPLRVIQSPDTAYNDITQLQQQLADGTLTVDQYLEQVQLQDPTIDPDPEPDPSDPTSPSTGTDTEWQPPTDPTGFALDLTQVFPFCIPFDLYAFLTCLNADPVTPVIEWEIAMPGGGSYPLIIDLSPFDSVAQLLRRLELLAFCIALAIKTRDLIKG